MKRIGLWNTAFLGDAVLTLPLLHTLHRAWPKAEIHFFVRQGLAPLFQAQPELAAVHAFDKRGAHKGLLAARHYGRALGNLGFDLFVSAHASLRSALVARFSGAPMRVGYDKPWFNRLLHTHTVDRAFDRFEEIERLLRLAAPLGIKNTIDRPNLVLPDDAREEADRILADAPRPLLGLHPGSTWPTKMWPLQFFADIMRRAHESGAGIALFAGPGEETLAARTMELSGLPDNAVLDLSGKLSLPTLAACLARLDCYLTNDSGPMHMAWVQGTPVTAMFGPTVRSLGFFPRGENARVMEIDLPCRPCSLHGPKTCPKGHHECMKDLTPDMVWDSVAAQLGLEQS